MHDIVFNVFNAAGTHKMVFNPTTVAFFFGGGGRGEDKYLKSATRLIPHIICHSNVHCFFHNSPPLLPILNQMNPVNTPLPPYLKSVLILSIIYSQAF
jgi:hypothetical protein